MKLKRCFPVKMKAEEDFGIIVRHAMNLDLFHLDAIQDCVPAVEKGIQINGLQFLQIS